MFLESIGIRRDLPGPEEGYPFNLPWLHAVERVDFTTPVTFLVGENGCGKSTLIEATATASRSITVGGQDVQTDPSMEQSRQLAKYLKPTWRKRTTKGFYLRAEDFINFSRGVNTLKREMEEDLADVRVRFSTHSEWSKALGEQPYRRSLAELNQRYGDLEAKSHGESFLSLFESRLVPNGLYLLDEPETPLSPVRQLAFIALIKDMVQQGSQFLIATHSPILMAFPNATLYHIEGASFQTANYDDLEHVSLTRSFLNNPDQYLRRL